MRDETASLVKLEQFKQVVLGDPLLAAALREETDRERFAALAVRLGAERGYEFTAEEVRKAMREARRAWLERWM